jgi:hypothetical protein
MRAGSLAVALVVACASFADAQTKKRPPTKATAATTSVKTVAADMTCPSVLGIGASTKRSFCDVLTGAEPKAGVLITLPPHRGTTKLLFDLHNRHTYSEEEVRSNQAYTRYTATIGVLAMDNTLIERAIVQSEFRKASDLVDRILGGALPGGFKAVAPTGTEHVSITIPQIENEVTILGEKLAVRRLDGESTYSSPGRPIAVISNLRVEYRPGPAPRKRR